MRTSLGLIIAVALLTACGGNESSGSPPEAQPPWYDGTQPGAAAAKLGGADTACPLPVAFDIPDKWEPEAVTTADFHEGGLELKCEIDGKPASVIGFLRVFTGTGAREHRNMLKCDESVVAHAWGEQRRFHRPSTANVVSPRARRAARNDGAAKVSTGPSGCFESRAASRSPTIATSTHSPKLVLLEDFRHAVRGQLVSTFVPFTC